MLIAFLCVTFITILTYRALFNSMNVQFTTYINNSLIYEPELEGESQKMALGETRDECADGSDGDEKIPAILAPAKIPKGMLSIKNTSHGVALFYNIIIL